MRTTQEVMRTLPGARPVPRPPGAWLSGQWVRGDRPGTEVRRALLALTVFCAAALAQNPAANLTVDAAANRRAINPAVYGIAYGTTAQLNDLNVPVNRYGGNNTSRYNWQINADNRGWDWYFQSIPEARSTPGERGHTFISSTRAGGAEPLLTVPMIGWVARLGPNRSKLAGFSIAKYGAQTGNDWQWFSDAGNGILQSTNQPVQGNDPNDASVPNSPMFQGQWIQNIVNQWGLAQNGGQRYYLLDNEHSLWHETHRDVHPSGAPIEEIRDTMLNYAAAIKGVDPGALIVGPEEWGWSGYLFSGADLQYGNKNGWAYLPDRANHGNMDYIPWLLNQLKLDGRHLLDVFTVHYYPQSGEFGNDVTTAVQQMRNRSTRSLWDTNYTDQSWINDKVRLIPRLRQWADTYYYPGTPIGITEYNWGAEGHINGATAQADILGIFGREGLDLAARWTTPAASTPTYRAIKMYRNYDGNKSTFGNVSVAANGSNPDNLAVFAAERTADQTLTVILISKYLSGNTPVNVAVNNFSTNGTARVYQLTSANAINRLADLNFTGSTVRLTVPAQSVTLLVLSGGAPNQPPVAVAGATPVSGTAPLSVVFNSTGSNDPDGSITSYAWNFGDGSTGSGPSPTHVYQNAGTFTAVLAVTDNRGATATSSVGITASANLLAAPSNLTGSAGRGSVTLNWVDNATAETGFHIERAPSGTSNFTRVGTVAANVKTFTQNVAKGTYLYRVQAFNATTVSGYSNTVTMRVK